MIKGGRMGLDISCKISKKSIRWNYSTLHLIRWLALQACGLPKEICGKTSYSWATSPFLHGYVIDGKELPSPDLMATILFSFKQAGYYFPNLMFHSDCEGNYTKSGKVFSKPELTGGNSTQLLKELELLKKEIPEQEKDSRTLVAFNQFYELVKDEVENGNGYIEFN